MTTTPTLSDPFLHELHWRGLIHQSTGLPELDRHLAAAPRTAYVGFDPTAPSLTIGNLVGIIVLVRFALAGHKPIIVVGGATGLIGDPSGKSAERTLNTPDTVHANVVGQTRIYHNVWTNAAALAARPLGEPPIRNNYDWFKTISFLDALRDIGKHFSVNMMIQKESVKERLTNRDQGISYTEFSYMLLQAYDYQHLWENESVTLQMGGSDQFGNIVCGIDLIDRRYNTMIAEADRLKAVASDPTATSVERDEAARVLADVAAWGAAHEPVERFGLTWPLVTKADGGKFGKTETGAVWLTADRTSPYAFYQFWLNAADADVPKFLRTFTLLPKAEIESLEAAHAANPGAREAHRALARHMTTLLHGPEQTDLAERAAKALFSGDIASLPEGALMEALAGAPTQVASRSLVVDKTPFVDLLVTLGVTGSKRDARDFLTKGSIAASGNAVGPNDVMSDRFVLFNSITPIRRGKKNWFVIKWE